MRKVYYYITLATEITKKHTPHEILHKCTKNAVNYKINSTSVCLDKFICFLVSFFFENRSQTPCTRLEVFSVLLNFSPATMRDAINLLLEMLRFKSRICTAIGSSK